MSKSKSGKGKPSFQRKRNRLWQGVLVFVLFGGLASSWFLLSGNPSAQQPSASAQSVQVEPEHLPPTLRNRIVLPAQPRAPRPRTLYPENFDNPEVKASYRAAKEAPEALENVACYCGCFQTSGHRNNLDCFVDNHGVTCAVCRGIALEAQRQHRLGTPVSQIKRIIDEQWAPKIR